MENSMPTNDTNDTNEDRIRRDIARAKDDLAMRELRELGRLENAVSDDDVITHLQAANETIVAMMVQLQDLLGVVEPSGGADVDSVDIESLARLARKSRLAVVCAFDSFRGYQTEVARGEAAIAKGEGATEVPAPKVVRSKRAKKTAGREARS